MSSAPDSPAGLPRLRCCRGSTPPPALVDGWLTCLALPDPVKQDLWRALEVAAIDPTGARTGPALEAFAHRHAGAATPTSMLAAIQTCAALVRMAAAANLDREAFQGDLRALSGRDDVAVQVIGEGYEGLKDIVRAAMRNATLTDHGKVLVGVDWRLEKVVGSSHGIDGSIDLIMLTLRWLDGDERGRTTLQVTPQAAMELRGFCDRFAPPSR